MSEGEFLDRLRRVQTAAINLLTALYVEHRPECPGQGCTCGLNDSLDGFANRLWDALLDEGLTDGPQPNREHPDPLGCWPVDPEDRGPARLPGRDGGQRQAPILAPDRNPP